MFLQTSMYNKKHLEADILAIIVLTIVKFDCNHWKTLV